MNHDRMSYEVITAIVDCHKGSNVLNTAKANGVTGGTILMGKGTVSNKFLEFLSLDSIEKEVVLMVTPKAISTQVMDAISNKFAFQKPNHGIAFSIDLKNFVDHMGHDRMEVDEIGRKTMHNAVVTIVDRGKAETVVEVAKAAGARGATLINGRGSGIHETDKVFAMQIEPEKEIALIIVEDEIMNPVIDAICEKLNIDQPGNGVVFTMPINEARGLVG